MENITVTRIDNETIEVSVGSSKTVLGVPEIEQLQKTLAQLRGTLLPAVTLAPATVAQTSCSIVLSPREASIPDAFITFS